MKKVIVLSFLIIGICSGINAQESKSYAKVYYKAVSADAGPVTVSIEDGVATEAYIKFKLRVRNTTSDYILVSTDNIIIKSNGQEYKNLERDLLIGPNDDDSRVIDIKGSGLRFDKFTIELKGFSRIPAASGEVKAENFKLPIVKNEFTAGPFKLIQLKSTKKTDDVVVKFSVDYNGDQIGIVHPGQVTLLTPKGTEFANMAPRGQRKPMLLKKGQNNTFVVLWKDIPVSNGDMQTANIELVWHDCFRNTVSAPFSLPDIEVEFDKGLSDAKNKR
ncbi:MAG: hypothetical protein EYC69_07185 [Bacteroidetes bacterium]|nr:MAG: hypothetical protein EYC69_07185 [Bacteroidota bacterium]